MTQRISTPKLSVGVDLGDRYSHVCVVDSAGDIIEEGRVQTTQAALHYRF